MPDVRTRTISRRQALRLLVGTGALGMGAALGAGGLTGCATTPQAKQGASDTTAEPATSSTFAFDTYCTFTVYGDDAAPALLARACARYDALFDLYDDASDIARINAAAGAPTTVDPATADIIKQALVYCEEANGRFDITIGAVSTLWDFVKGVRPTDAEIARALPHVNWTCVTVDESDPDAPTVTLTDPAAKLDLGGIAKGYIADKLCELLRDETAATAAAISLGSNVVYLGEKPDGSPWETGIRDPNDPGGSTVVDTVSTRACSLVTSGLYERTFTLDDVTYWHILDPATGMPVVTDTVSVTVLSPSSTRADALSTTLFIAGSEAGANLVDAYSDTAAYFITTSGAVRTSSRWDELTSAG